MAIKFDAITSKFDNQDPENIISRSLAIICFLNSSISQDEPCSPNAVRVISSL